MLRFLFSALGTFLLACALASAIIDAYVSFSTKHLVINGLANLFEAVTPAQYETFLSILNARYSSNLAHLFQEALKHIPIFLALGAAGLLLLTIAAKPKQKIGFSSR